MADFTVKKIADSDKYEVQEPDKTVEGVKTIVTLDNLDTQIAVLDARKAKLVAVRGDIVKVEAEKA